jgi:hypothetical protein
MSQEGARHRAGLWLAQARLLDKLYAPTHDPDALGDELPADVFGPEDAAAALEASDED